MLRMSLQETMDRLLLLTRSGYPVIYIVSHEESRVFDYLARLMRVLRKENPGKKLLRWDTVNGLKCFGDANPYGGAAPINWLDLPGLDEQSIAGVKSLGNEQAADLALQSIMAAEAEPKSNDYLPDSLTVFFDLHPFLMRVDKHPVTGGLMVRPLRNAADSLRKYYDRYRTHPSRAYKTVVIVAPTATDLSLELERDQIVLDFPVPETEELKKAFDGMVGRGLLKYADGAPDEDRQRLRELIAGAGRGLTLDDYQLGLNGFAVRAEPLSEHHIEDMLSLKAKAINNPALQYTPHVDIELGGLEAVKKWVQIRKEAIAGETIRKRFYLPPANGLMLCGVSGGGKSQLAKLIAKEFNLALLRLDVGALFGQYVGESEERTRQALQLAEVLAPVVLWLDEVDKAFTGVGGGGDSGVSDRVFGFFLTWLAEKQDSVFVVTTANDFKKVLDRFPEFGRKGRFDEIVWVGLPNDQARKEIFKIYLKPHVDTGYLALREDEVRGIARKKHKLLPEQTTDALELFCDLLSQSSVETTGAEIEYAVNEALYTAYVRHREGHIRTPALESAVVLQTVEALSGRALYHTGSDDAKKLATQLVEVNKRMWLHADETANDLSLGAPGREHDDVRESADSSDKG